MQEQLNIDKKMSKTFNPKQLNDQLGFLKVSNSNSGSAVTPFSLTYSQSQLKKSSKDTSNNKLPIQLDQIQESVLGYKM